MIQIMLLDDDRSVLDILQRIIKKTGIGNVCGSYTDPEEALCSIASDAPDVVLVDLLMPEIDGITFVRKAREAYADASYIMLSQVSDKHMLADAYSAGIRFFIQKPVNSVEVSNVIRNVYEHMQLSRTMQQVSQLIAPGISGSSEQDAAEVVSPKNKNDQYIRRLRKILSDLGILGQRGADEIVQVCEHYMDQEKHLQDQSLKDICALFTDAPKSMEQRIRRAAMLGLVNLAHVGIEDFASDTFTRYSSALYGFDQVRTEMNCIQGKSEIHGVVKIRQFLTALIYMCKE